MKEAEVKKGAGITYKPDEVNINRMKQGLAPFGISDSTKPVELHHIKGRSFDDIVQMEFKFHRAKGTGFHSQYGFKISRI